MARAYTTPRRATPNLEVDPTEGELARFDEDHDDTPVTGATRTVPLVISDEGYGQV